MFRRKKKKSAKKETKKEAKRKSAAELKAARAAAAKKAEAAPAKKKAAPAKQAKKKDEANSNSAAAADPFASAAPPPAPEKEDKASSPKKGDKAEHAPTVAPETPLPDAPGLVQKAPSKRLEAAKSPKKIETDEGGRPRARSDALNKETAEKLLEHGAATPRGAFNMPRISKDGSAPAAGLSSTRSRGRSKRGEKHGWTEKEIEDAIRKFEKNEEIQALLKKNRNKWKAVNRAILSDEGPPEGVKTLCKGTAVGRRFVTNAKKKQHNYMIANTQSCILTIPWKGPLSIGGMMAQPAEPIYNAVSLNPKEHARTVRHMQLALRRAMADAATPGSRARKVYLTKLRTGLSCSPSAPEYTAIKQKRNGIDSTKISVDETISKVTELLDKFYASAKENGVDLGSLVHTAFHVHPSHSVGALHMHGYFLDVDLRMESMDSKMMAKSTPVDRFMAVLAKTRAVKEPDLTDLVVQVTNP